MELRKRRDELTYHGEALADGGREGGSIGVHDACESGLVWSYTVSGLDGMAHLLGRRCICPAW